MSWAPVAGIVKQDCCMVAPDLRGHGLTTSADDGMLSLHAMTEDVISLLAEIFTSGTLLGPRTSQKQPSSTSDGVSNPAEADRQSPVEGPEELQGASSAVYGGGYRTPRSEVGSGNRDVVSPVGLNADEPKNHDETTAASSTTLSGSRPPATFSGLPSKPPPPAFQSTTEQGDRCAIGSSDSDDSDGHIVSDGCIENVGTGSGRNFGFATGNDDGNNDCMKLLLVGHSVGGSLAVRVAGFAEELKRRCQGAAEVGGAVAVDVVEGTALVALDDMPEVWSLQ